MLFLDFPTFFQIILLYIFHYRWNMLVKDAEGNYGNPTPDTKSASMSSPSMLFRDYNPNGSFGSRFHGHKAVALQTLSLLLDVPFWIMGFLVVVTIWRATEMIEELKQVTFFRIFSESGLEIIYSAFVFFCFFVLAFFPFKLSFFCIGVLFIIYYLLLWLRNAKWIRGSRRASRACWSTGLH
jgi:hypothetical protein